MTRGYLVPFPGGRQARKPDLPWFQARKPDLARSRRVPPGAKLDYNAGKDYSSAET